KLSPEKRFEHAINLVLSGEASSISEAARLCGVSRPRLSEKVKEAREKRAEMQARAERAAAEADTRRQAEDRPLLVQGETLRVPPIDEFVRRYFDGLKCPRHGVHHDIPEYQDEIMQKVSDPKVKRLLVNVPPGHSKS